MTASFCTRCGTQQVPGAAFCPACGQPAAAQPVPPAYQQPPPQMPYQQPPQQPYGAPPHMGAPAPQQGMSSNTKFGIGIAVALAIGIGYYVQQNEAEFQRNRRAAQPPATAPANPQPQAPATQGQPQAEGSTPAYKGYESGGTPGTPEWTRNQLIGRWSVRGCDVSTVEFRQDGTTFSAAGNETLSGTWTYQHPRLTVVERGTTTALEIISMGDEMITDFQGRRQTWRRC